MRFPLLNVGSLALATLLSLTAILAARPAAAQSTRHGNTSQGLPTSDYEGRWFNDPAPAPARQSAQREQGARMNPAPQAQSANHLAPRTTRPVPPHLARQAHHQAAAPPHQHVQQASAMQPVRKTSPAQEPVRRVAYQQRDPQHLAENVFYDDDPVYQVEELPPGNPRNDARVFAPYGVPVEDNPLGVNYGPGCGSCSCAGQGCTACDTLGLGFIDQLFEGIFYGEWLGQGGSYGYSNYPYPHVDGVCADGNCGDGACGDGGCGGGACGDACFDGNCASGRCQWRSYENLEIFGGAHGFRTPVDRGHGNFGLHEGLNWGGPLWHAYDIGFQLGGQAVHSNFDGDSAIGYRDETRNQYFLTAGIFRRFRYPTGMQWGVVYDFLRDDYYAKVDMAQVRGEISYRGPRGNEIGFMFSTNVKDDEANFAINGVSFTEIWQTEDMYAAFWRREFHGGHEARVWGGATGEGSGIFGAQARATLSDRLAALATFNYLSSNGDALVAGYPQDSWGVNINFIYYIGKTARSAACSPWQPLMPVADNTSMMMGIQPR